MEWVYTGVGPLLPRDVLASRKGVAASLALLASCVARRLHVHLLPYLPPDAAQGGELLGGHACCVRANQFASSTGRPASWQCAFDMGTHMQVAVHVRSGHNHFELVIKQYAFVSGHSDVHKEQCCVPSRCSLAAWHATCCAEYVVICCMPASSKCMRMSGW